MFCDPDCRSASSHPYVACASVRVFLHALAPSQQSYALPCFKVGAELLFCPAPASVLGRLCSWASKVGFFFFIILPLFSAAAKPALSLYLVLSEIPLLLPQWQQTSAFYWYKAVSYWPQMASRPPWEYRGCASPFPEAALGLCLCPGAGRFPTLPRGRGSLPLLPLWRRDFA